MSDMRSLLEAAEGGFDPSPEDRARVRAKLTAQLGPSAFAKPASSARTGLFAAVGAGVIGLAALAIWLARPSEHAPAPSSSPPAVVATTLTPPRVGEHPSERAGFAAAATSEQQAFDLEPTPVPVESLRVLPATPHETKRAPAVNAQPSSSLEAELALLRDAKKALDEGDSDRSLRILSEHERRFPSGVLVEERAATRVLALCSAERVSEARVSATDFLARYPRSPSAPRVRSSCGGAP